MLEIRFICVGRLKEKFYIQAIGEYAKRLQAYCRFELVELSEVRLPDNPSDAQIAAALREEGSNIKKNIPSGALVVSMCVEGRKMSSQELSKFIFSSTVAGKSKMCFIIGGSYGLSDEVKEISDLKLSMSDMTFPHHLARVMLAEQIYRAFKIAEGSKYHK